MKIQFFTHTHSKNELRDITFKIFYRLVKLASSQLLDDEKLLFTVTCSMLSALDTKSKDFDTAYDQIILGTMALTFEIKKAKIEIETIAGTARFSSFDEKAIKSLILNKGMKVINKHQKLERAKIEMNFSNFVPVIKDRLERYAPQPPEHLYPYSSCNIL